MIQMTELDVINDALSTMGEVPLNDADEVHPLVAQIKRFLTEESKQLQHKGWWFNTEYVTLSPDALSKFIYVPQDTLSANPVVRPGPGYKRNFIQRGRRLYDTDKNTYIFDSDVEVKLTRYIPFEDLPIYAQRAVSTATSRRFQQAYDADGRRDQQLLVDMQLALQLLEQEDVRIRKPNLINKSTTARSLNRIAFGRYNRGY